MSVTTNDSVLAEGGASAPALSNHAGNEITIVKQTGGRPDLQHHQNQLEEIKKGIEKYTGELNDVKAALSGSAPPANTPEGKRRAELQAELDSIRQSQAGNKGARGKILDDLKILQDGLNVKIKNLQAAKSKSTYKFPDDIDSAIARLTAQVDTGALKLVDEKRALAEISNLRKSRKAVEAFADQQKAIDTDRESVEKLRAQLDDPASKALSKRFDEIRIEMDEIRQKTEKSRGSRSELVKKRTELQALLDEQWSLRRARQDAYRKENEAFQAKRQAERQKREERFREEKRAEEDRKRKEEETRLREDAALPAYGKEIEDCNVLINYFSGKAGMSDDVNGVDKKERELEGVKKLELRKVEADESLAGARLARKKGGEEEEDEEGYFVGGKGKKGKGKRKNNNRGTLLSLSEGNGEVPAEESNPSKETPLNVPLSTLSALLALNIPVPAHASDVPRVVENLRRKKVFFLGDQDRRTKENIANVEKKLGAIKVNDESATNGRTESETA